MDAAAASSKAHFPVLMFVDPTRQAVLWRGGGALQDRDGQDEQGEWQCSQDNRNRPELAKKYGTDRSRTVQAQCRADRP